MAEPIGAELRRRAADGVRFWLVPLAASAAVVAADIGDLIDGNIV